MLYLFTNLKHCSSDNWLNYVNYARTWLLAIFSGEGAFSDSFSPRRDLNKDLKRMSSIEFEDL